MTHSEARILVYLTQVQTIAYDDLTDEPGTNYRTAPIISHKLRLEYSFACKLLNRMREKEWVRKEEVLATKNYWFISKTHPISIKNKAYEVLKDGRQAELPTWWTLWFEKRNSNIENRKSEIAFKVMFQNSILI